MKNKKSRADQYAEGTIAKQVKGIHNSDRAIRAVALRREAAIL